MCLYKVPAHAGLISNERADQLVKEAAVEDCIAREVKTKSLPPVNWRWVEEGDGYVGREVCTVSAETPMHSMYWPTFLATEASPSAEAAAVPGDTGQRWHLSDLSKSLKRHMHALYR
jgi:ribonuclease HI